MTTSKKTLKTCGSNPYLRNLLILLIFISLSIGIYYYIFVETFDITEAITSSTAAISSTTAPIISTTTTTDPALIIKKPLQTIYDTSKKQIEKTLDDQIKLDYLLNKSNKLYEEMKLLNTETLLKSKQDMVFY